MLEPSFEAFEAAWARGREPGRLCPAGGRSGHAGQPDAEAGRGAGRYLHAGIGDRRRSARALFHRRHEARSDLALPWHAVARSTARRGLTRRPFSPCPAHPLDTLRALIAESRIDLPDGLPAIAAGLFGYLGYDMIRLVEHLPDVNPDPLGLPDAVLMRPSVVAVLDGVKGEVTVVAPAWAGSGLSARAAYAQAAERVMDALRDLDRAPAAAGRDLGEAARGRARRGRTSPMRATRPRWKRPRTTSAPATSFRSCPASAGRWISRCRPSRFIAACGAPTRRPSCSSSTSAAFRWSAPAPKSWCACAMAK